MHSKSNFFRVFSLGLAVMLLAAVDGGAQTIGNDTKGVWTRTYGLAKINQIMGVLNDVMGGKVEETSRNAEVKP